MATIPLGTKFTGLSADYPTVERRSALINSESQTYTMQDIIDTVPAGAAVNPTNQFLPINNGGVFADSTFKQITYSGTNYTTVSNSVFFQVESGGGHNTIVADSSFDQFGIGNKTASNDYSSTGLWVSAPIGVFGLNVGDNPNNPEFKRDKIMQLFSMRDAMYGSQIAIASGNISLYSPYALSVDVQYLGFYGSGLYSNVGVGTYVQAPKWLKIQADDYQEYYIPLYQ